MYRFFKAQLSSFLSSMADYCCTLLAVEVFGCWYLLGSTCGTITGGLLNFSLGRSWVFRSVPYPVGAQLFRYLLVCSGYLVLATSGIFLFTHFLHLNYLVSKITVTLMLAVSYSYPLQKAFVFK